MNNNHTATIEEHAIYRLYKNDGPMTVNDVASNTGYSHGYTRKRLKELLEEGKIGGEKTTSIVGCSVNGNLIVLTSSYSGMMETLRRDLPDLAKRAAENTSNVSELQDFIKGQAESTFIIGRRWEFWYPPEPERELPKETVPATADHQSPYRVEPRPQQPVHAREISRNTFEITSSGRVFERIKIEILDETVVTVELYNQNKFSIYWPTNASLSTFLEWIRDAEDIDQKSYTELKRSGSRPWCIGTHEEVTSDLRYLTQYRFCAVESNFESYEITWEKYLGMNELTILFRSSPNSDVSRYTIEEFIRPSMESQLSLSTRYEEFPQVSKEIMRIARE
jgi:DNA-binding Lrp family transcriptional regulator